MRNRWTFWATVAAVLALCGVPSAVLWDSLLRYHRFLTGYQPGVLKPSRSSRRPPHDSSRDGRETLQFVEFKLKSPKARRVTLQGDLNRWTTAGIELTRQPDGVWEVLVPLPPGRYGYRYTVDGAETLDPIAPSEDDPPRGRVSIKNVP